MDRMACVDVPALPLQLLMARHPDWTEHPAVVVDQDKPQGKILWLNSRARRCGVRTGMRYAAGLALASDLRAGEVSDNEIRAGCERIVARLRRFTPEVEASSDEPGVFWLDASGLTPLYSSLLEWARQLVADLDGRELYAAIAVGFSRFGTYAAAKARGRIESRRRGRSRRRARQPGITVFEDAAEERDTAQRVPLGLLEIEPELRDTLHKLGVRTVGAFARLPAAGIRRRFGPEAHRLHRLAIGELSLPLQPQSPLEPICETVELEPAETDVTRLLFLVKQRLDRVLAATAARYEAVEELIVDLRLERRVDGGDRDLTETVRTAAPTLDVRQILNLVHLRFESLKLPAGVTRCSLTARSVRASRRQLQLFAQQSRRDLEAADRALARIRAELGDDSVFRARLADGHLPEASYSWQPLAHVLRPDPQTVAERPLVRRIFSRPRRLPARPRNEPDGWLLRGFEHGNVQQVHGPYIVSGGWWIAPVHREYYFTQTRDGEWFWTYYDRRRRRWFLHGQVE